jgi:transcriptional regulator with XRE-family HTH domain
MAKSSQRPNRGMMSTFMGAGRCRFGAVAGWPLMSLFFDAAWFDAKLAARNLDRAALAIAAGIDRGELHGIFTNERAPTLEEMESFARVLETDLLEITLRSGVAERAPAGADTADRIESIEARLKAIDDWLAEFEQKKASG